MGLWFVGFLHLVPASYLLSSHSKVSSPLFKQRFLSISLSPSHSPSLSTYTHLPGERERGETQLPNTDQMSKKRKALEGGGARLPPEDPRACFGAGEEQGRAVEACRWPGGWQLGAHRRGASAWLASRSPPTLGWLWRLGQAALTTRLETARLFPPYRHWTSERGRVKGGKGKGRGKGVWEGGWGGLQGCWAVQAPFLAAVCHWHGHSHTASLICSLCKSLFAGCS